MAAACKPAGRILPIVAAAAALALLPSVASGSPRPTAEAAAAKGTPRAHRVGGPVRKAWPAKGRAPRTQLARWLARQVGPKRARRLAGEAPSGEPIELLRSYDIPRDDPSYDRLLNWSWTYDSAVAAAAFAAVGERRQATRLLDQLAALQRTDGSIDLAFNVSTHESARPPRSGTVAWLGLAAVTYDAAFESDRYRETAERAARFLLALERPSGLLAGGPDVKWVSTQHNLVAYTMLERLGDELERAGDGKGAGAHHAAAATIGAAIDAKLLVAGDGAAYFRQGLDDDTQALDTQAIGSMYLIGRSQPQLGRLVLAGAESGYAIGDRSIELSPEKATFNGTYAAGGPFIGYRPYLGADAPDVLWFEGTAEMRLAHAAFGDDTSELDASMARWSAITSGRGEAPLGADRTITDGGGGEYHVWPSGAAASWSLLSAAAPAFFVAPLPDGTKLVTDWTLVRGDEKQIRTFPDGRVDMIGETGERRVLAGSAKLRDYTVTVDAQLSSGNGFGVYVRATTGDDSALSGYAVLYDRAGGTIALKQVDDDRELSVPLASMRPPPGFDWDARHRISVTIAGDGLAASIDGLPVLDVPRIAAASAAAAKASGAHGLPTAASGRYGLRAWDKALVRFEQFTVVVG